MLLEQDLTPIVGPLLLDFAMCTSGQVTVDGEVRATWLASEERLLMAGALAFITPMRTTPATIEADLRPDLLQLGVPLADDTAVIDLTETTAAIRLADGVVQCSADGSTPCDLDP